MAAENKNRIDMKKISKILDETWMQKQSARQEKAPGWTVDNIRTARRRLRMKDRFSADEKLCRYPVLANGAALAACFAALGSGWDRSGLVAVIMSSIIYFGGGIVLGSIGVFFVHGADASADDARKEIEINGYTLHARQQYISYIFSNGCAVFATLLSGLLFFVGIIMIYVTAPENNFAATSRLEAASQAEISGDRIELWVMNTGGRAGSVRPFFLTVMTKNNPAPVVIRVELQGGETPFIRPGEQRVLPLGLRWSATRAGEIANIGSDNFSKCSISMRSAQFDGRFSRNFEAEISCGDLWYLAYQQARMMPLQPNERRPVIRLPRVGRISRRSRSACGGRSSRNARPASRDRTIDAYAIKHEIGSAGALRPLHNAATFLVGQMRWRP